MPSTYSTNLKIELQATGENAGTWGTITNTNLGTALEQAIVGYGNPNYASDANLTLTYTDTNAAQAARALVLNVTSGVSLTGTRELVVPTIQKQYIVQNNTTGSQSITVKTSGGTGVTVPNGRKAHLYVDGTNVIYMDDYVDINGGSIDGTTIGANSAAAGTFTTATATTGNITTVNATTVDATNVEVTNVKAKDGTAAIAIADSTGAVTVSTPTVVSVNSSSDALRITQVGAGNALVVEDSANPDASPFVIDQNGTVISGYTARVVNTDQLEVHATGANSNQPGISSFNWSAAGGAVRPSFNLFKSKSGAVGSYSVLASGDNIGSINFLGDDGSAFVSAASILAAVDGTPGTNDMPGRLVFSTTADGASTPTERMRIDSTGAVGIGTASLGSGYGLRVTKTLTDVTSGQGVVTQVTANSTITNLFGFNTSLNSATNSGTPYTITQFAHYNAAQGTVNADSTVTNQFGFVAASSLTGATNNYGFYGNIASGTNRWNFYANGTADNYFGGPTTINVNSSSDALRITQVGAGNALVVEDSANPDASPLVVDTSGNIITGATSVYSVAGVWDSRITSNASSSNGRNAGLTAFAWSTDNTGNLFHAGTIGFGRSGSNTIGTQAVVGNTAALGAIRFAGSDGTNFIEAARIASFVDGTPGTNDMPGRLTFSTTADGAATPTERMRIDSSGNVGIGTSSPGALLHVSNASAKVRIGLTASDQYTDIYRDNATGYTIYNAAQAATFRGHIFQLGGTEAFRIDSSGNVGIGTSSPVAGYRLNVVNDSGNAQQLIRAGTNFNSTIAFGDQDSSTSGQLIYAHNGDYMAFNTNAAERMRIDSSGNVGIGGTPGAAEKVAISGTLPANGGLSFGFLSIGTIPSTATSVAVGHFSRINPAAASFTLTNLRHFMADQSTFGAGSTVSNQVGFYVENTLTGATNNYGFYSAIASGSNRWNFYAAGTALNYFAGDTLIGTSTNATGITTRFLTKSGSAYAAAAIFESDGSAANWARTDWKNANIATTGIIYMDQGGEFAIRNDGNYAIAFYTNGGNERMRITNAGNIVAGASAALATTATNGFLYVPTCAGTPTGTPTAITGMAPIVVDTTNNKLYFYSGGQWRDAGP